MATTKTTPPMHDQHRSDETGSKSTKLRREPIRPNGLIKQRPSEGADPRTPRWEIIGGHLGKGKPDTASDLYAKCQRLGPHAQSPRKLNARTTTIALGKHGGMVRTSHTQLDSLNRNCFAKASCHHSAHTSWHAPAHTPKQRAQHGPVKNTNAEISQAISQGFARGRMGAHADDH